MTWMRGWLNRWIGGRPPIRRERAGLGALLRLDDRLLADIGLRRAEVAAVASGQLPLDQLNAYGPLGPGDAWPLPDGPAGAADRPDPRPLPEAA